MSEEDQQTTSAEAPDNFKDPDQAELEYKMCKDINAMPEEVRDRFKALKVLYDQVNDLDEEEEKEYRQLELKYEKMYAEIYAKRALLVKGLEEPSQNLIDQFEEVKNGLADQKYNELEVPICDVKDIQNTEKGVSGFWQRAMLGHQSISKTIVEKDRPILAYLQDIQLDLHEKGQGYTLKFVFEKNSYFEGTELTKQFIQSKPNVIEKCIGTEINWTAGSDPTKEKKKKKVKKAGGGKKTVTKEVKCDSFFNFFETIALKEKEGGSKKKDDSEEEEDEDDVGERMDADFDIGNDFKDDLIPLALEYYLGVIEQESDDDDDDEGDDDDSDEEDKK